MIEVYSEESGTGMELDMYKLACRLFPINRSITGTGIRHSMQILKEICPEFKILSFKTGERVYDWTIPKEWNIKDAYLEHLETGQKFCEFKKNNLHVVNYSTPQHRVIAKAELEMHLHSREDLPNAIPYITSYYQENWGFCIDHKTRIKLPEGEYKIEIDAELRDGKLELMEADLEGESSKTIFFSSYLCHPSMANNELSGPVVLAKTMEYVRNIKGRRLSYKFYIGPETIGAISYLSIRREALQKNTYMAYVLTCVGDENRYTQVKSISGNNAADRALESAIRKKDNYICRSFLERGSDERQYGSSLINLPVTTFARSLFREYKEYHTSLDDLEFISEKGLQESYEVMKTIIDAIEFGIYLKPKCYCEPQLGKYGLYPMMGKSRERKHNFGRIYRNIMAYANGKIDIFNLTISIDSELGEVLKCAGILKENGLITSSINPF